MSTQGCICTSHQIMDQGTWSNMNTFNKHYGRIAENSPAGILLQDVVGRCNIYLPLFNFMIFYLIILFYDLLLFNFFNILQVLGRADSNMLA